MRGKRLVLLLCLLFGWLASTTVTTSGAPSAAPEWIKNRSDAIDALIQHRWLNVHLQNSADRCVVGCWYFITTVAHWSWDSLSAIETAKNIEQEYLQWYMRFPSSLPLISFAFLDVHHMQQLFNDLHINQVPSFNLMWMHDLKPDGRLLWKGLNLPDHVALNWHEKPGQPGYYWDVLQSLVQLFLHNRQQDLTQTGGYHQGHQPSGAVNKEFVVFESLEGLNFYRRSFVEPLLVVSPRRHAVLEASSSRHQTRAHKLHRRGVISAANSTLAVEFGGCLHSLSEHQHRDGCASTVVEDENGDVLVLADDVIAVEHMATMTGQSEADHLDCDYAILFGVDQCWYWSNEATATIGNDHIDDTDTDTEIEIENENESSFEGWLVEALQDVEVLAFRSGNILDAIPTGVSAVIGLTNTFDPDHELLLESLATLSRFVRAGGLQDRLRIGVLDAVLYSDFCNALRWPAHNETDVFATPSSSSRRPLLPRHRGENFKILELEESRSPSSTPVSWHRHPIAPHRYLFVNPAADLAETFVTSEFDAMQQWLVRFPLVLHADLHLLMKEANPCPALASHFGESDDTFSRFLDAKEKRLVFVWIEQRACGFDQSFLPVWEAVEEHNRTSDLLILFLRVPKHDGQIRSGLNMPHTPNLFVLTSPDCQRVAYDGDYTVDSIQAFIESL